jgi:hypothetical protein
MSHQASLLQFWQICPKPVSERPERIDWLTPIPAARHEVANGVPHPV